MARPKHQRPLGPSYTQEGVAEWCANYVCGGWQKNYGHPGGITSPIRVQHGTLLPRLSRFLRAGLVEKGVQITSLIYTG